MSKILKLIPNEIKSAISLIIIGAIVGLSTFFQPVELFQFTGLVFWNGCWIMSIPMFIKGLKKLFK